MNNHIRTCKGENCHAEIVWLKLPGSPKRADGKPRRLPVDASSLAVQYAQEDREFEKDNADLVSHFTTCPDAASFRTKP